jgi:hypothetical protein
MQRRERVDAPARRDVSGVIAKVDVLDRLA